MRFLNVSGRIFGATTLASFIFVTGCFKNPGSQSLPQLAVQIPVTPVYNYTDIMTSYLHATGSCNGNSQIEFKYYSDVDSTQKTQTADCNLDKVDVQLAITYGNKPQNFTVIETAIMRTTRSNPYTLKVPYSPPPPLTPGFAILSGGGHTSSAQAQIFSSIGEVVTPATLKDPVSGNILRTGVQGVNDP